MANALKELFTNQAAAIREGLGDIGKFSPIETPGLIRQIVSMIGTGEGGNSGGTIVDGKGNVKFASGTFDTTTVGVNRQVIYHGLDDYPDFIAVFATWMGADASDYTKEDYRIAAIYGVSSDYSSAAFQCRTCYVNGSNIDSNGNKWDGDSWSAIDDGDPSLHPVYTFHHTIYTPTYNKFYVGWNESVEAGRGKYLFLPNTVYRWVAISGIGSGSSADVRYVTFTNPATGETFVKPVAVGDDCVDVVAKGLWAKPTQESTAQYDYAFANSWSAEPNGSADANILKNITEDKTVYAVFTATLRKYTITWLDSDGVTELPGQKQWAYGDMPSYVPIKSGYQFNGWTPAISDVTGDASYVAQWIEMGLENMTWEEIAQISEAGTAANYFSVGDRKSITINGKIGVKSFNVTWYAYIIGIYHNSELEGSGIHFSGFFDESQNIHTAPYCAKYNQSSTEGGKYFNIYHWGDANNIRGWAGSDIRYDILGSTDVAPSGYGSAPVTGRVGYDATDTCATSPVANTLMSCLPIELREVMKPIAKWTNNDGGSTAASVTATLDYLPLLSPFEVTGSLSVGSSTSHKVNTYEKNYQAQYEYFISGPNERQVYYSASSPMWWYMRSPVTSTSARWTFYDPQNNKPSQGYLTTCMAIRPVFMV